MKGALLFLIALLTGYNSFSQDNYATSLIPQTLLSRANATIRNEETTVDMQSPTEVNLKVDRAITILNSNGENSARLVLFYDKNTVIKSAKGEVYNEFGKLMGKFSMGDFRDESAVQGISLFEDSRVKHYLPSVSSYPYTVVFHYEIKFKQNLVIPDWRPKPANDVSVEKSTYAFVCKPTDQIRIKSENYPGQPRETLVEKRKALEWSVSNLSALRAEPYSPNEDTYLTSVKIAPEEFSYFNIKGNYRNWAELGKWSYDNLLKGRNTLPALTVERIKALVKNETSEKEKARKIYQYVQDKTRYISVQIGIGGFQPASAAEVDRLGYGDCKALVNYTQSLLSTVGIESFYCVVEAGTKKVSLDPVFASMNQGNHIILCLPLKGDTTWLECTSQTIPFGFLGDFTDDRYVLACTPEGGRLLRTPKLINSQNQQVRTASVTLSKEGSVYGTIHTVYKGTQYDRTEMIVTKPISEQQRMLKSAYDIDNINFEQISFEQKKDENPTLTETLRFNIKNYASTNSDKMFLMVNAFNVQRTIPEVRNRVMPVYIARGFVDIDTIVYHLPENLVPLTELINKSFKNELGEYECKINLEDKRLVYSRKMILREGTFPPEMYAAFFQFITEINSADHFKMIFSLKK